MAKVMWVHTSKKGRSCRRISGWLCRVFVYLFGFSLFVAVMWSLLHPNCDASIGCSVLTPATPIDYLHCSSECERTACVNMTCAPHLRCEELLSDYQTALQTSDRARHFNEACGTTTAQGPGAQGTGCGGNRTVEQAASAADQAALAAEQASTAAKAALAAIPVSCDGMYDVGSTAYRWSLAVDYRHTWLPAVAALGEQQCRVAAAVEKCSACTGDSTCHRAAPTYPSHAELCSVILEVSELPPSKFCTNQSWADERPCVCLTIWDRLVPNEWAFRLVFSSSFLLASIILVHVWLRWVPEIVDVGVVGMSSSRSTRGFVLPPGESVLSAIDLLETKLGRSLSTTKVHEPWVYEPSLARCANTNQPQVSHTSTAKLTDKTCLIITG